MLPTQKRMFTIMTEENTLHCQRNWLTVLLSLAFFVGASVSYASIHNDDSRHQVHQLVHSSICKWVKDSKCGLNKTAYTTQPSLAAAVCTVAAPEHALVSDSTLPCLFLKQFYIVFQLHERAPPLPTVAA